MMAPVQLRSWLDEARAAARHGCRLAARRRASTVATIVVLACGIGVAVAIFTVSNAVLLRPLPIADQERVVALWGKAEANPRTLPLSPAHFERYQRQARTLEAVAGTVGIDSWAQPVRYRDETVRMNVSPVTGNFFSVLGAAPALGRLFGPDDDHPGADPVAVLGYAFWRGQLAGDPSVLGRSLELRNGRVVTVIGVAPAGLRYPLGTEIWIPFSTFSVLEVMPVGRLAGGASLQNAAEELRRSFESESDAAWRGVRTEALALPTLIVGDVRAALLLLAAAAAVVLAASCLNACNLLLLQAAERRKEFATRRALGARGVRIAGQLIAEMLPMMAVAAAFGLWLASQLVQAAVALSPSALPRADEVGLLGIPAWLAAGIACTAAFTSVLVPAVWAGFRTQAADWRVRGATPGHGFALLQNGAVVFQLALAISVLALAGLLGRTLHNLYAVDTGLAADHVAIVDLSWPDRSFTAPEHVDAMYAQLLPRIKALPGVAAVATVNVVPFTGATGGWDGPFVADIRPTMPLTFNFAVVGDEYFDALGVPLVSGRGFERGDRDGAVAVAIVSAEAAAHLWSGGAAVGRRLRLAGGDNPWLTVVGVARETRYRGLRVSSPTVYLPVRQFKEVLPLITTVAVRTHGRPDTVLPGVRRAVAATDGDVSVLHAATLADLMAAEFTTVKVTTMLIGLFAGAAVFLASVGLGALLASIVKQRRRELAIRQALGATPARIRASILGRSTLLSGAGLALGLALTFSTGRLLESVLYGVAPHDLLTGSGIAVLVGLLTLGASYVPARRATRLDLVRLLQEE